MEQQQMQMWQQQMMMFQQMWGGAAWGSSGNTEMQWKMKLHEALTKGSIDKPTYTSTPAESGG